MSVFYNQSPPQVQCFRRNHSVRGPHRHPSVKEDGRR